MGTAPQARKERTMTSAAELSERLLRADSATRELEQWCQQHGIGDGRIVAIRQADESPERLDDHSLDVLNNYRAAKSASFRRVRLITAGIAVVEALNWYFPANLTAEMREQLLTTEMPFGHVIAQLHPRRHTFFVRHSPLRGKPARSRERTDLRSRSSITPLSIPWMRRRWPSFTNDFSLRYFIPRWPVLTGRHGMNGMNGGARTSEMRGFERLRDEVGTAFTAIVPILRLLTGSEHRNRLTAANNGLRSCCISAPLLPRGR
jgi:hypothetical protein